MICAYCDGGEREAALIYSPMRRFGLLHPLQEVRREVMFTPRPVERARYRCNEQLFDDLEVYIDVLTGRVPDAGKILPARN